jgi:pantoate--beta-alanine ligase
MGALHAGHAALIRAAAGMAGGNPCVVSIFVNPTQFNQASDFARYPRTLEADLAVCGAAGAAAVFAPAPEMVYPPGRAIEVPALPAVATEPGLEDAFRPGHFAGVCQVVKRLFELLRPEAAVFGEKDWQQLRVVSAMSEASGLGVRVVPHATQRDADGLAMSSRNRFLTATERAAALAIPRALAAAVAERAAGAAEGAMRAALSGLRVEYAAVRDAAALGPIGRGPGRALIAAWSGATRLIDNAPWPGSG